MEIPLQVSKNRPDSAVALFLLTFLSDCNNREVEGKVAVGFPF